MEIPRHWRLKAQRYRLEGSIARPVGTSPSRPAMSALAAQHNLYGSLPTDP